MANYTIELKNLPNNVFNFSYPFYCESPQAKREFEERFIGHYFFHEIGFETIDRFQHVLAERLRLRMPYYQQLYQTEWQQTQKDMMLSKSLVETLTREIILEGSNESLQSSSGTHTSSSEQSQSGSDKVTNEQTQTGSSTSTGTSTGTSSNNVTTKESSVNDGVSFVNLEEANLTLHSNQDTQVDSSSTSTGESSDEQQLTSSHDTISSSELSSSSEDTNSLQSSSSGTNQSKQIETQTFLSEGDVGIQTPAYAITEWRKIIININEMIIKECADLFMQIY